MRIELEKSLRDLYEVGNPDKKSLASLSRIVNELQHQGDISSELAESILKIIKIANRAVHGEYIRTEDAEELALIGVRLLEELKQRYTKKVSKPVESKIIERNEVDRLMFSKYRVTTVIPYVDKPRMNTYIFDQNSLDKFLERYNEYAEFIVSVEPMNSEKVSISNNDIDKIIK